MKLTQKTNNLYDMISSAELDPQVGIRIAHLTGDDSFSLFGAEISPYRKIAAHYHHVGPEIYQIIEGDGTMYTGKVTVAGDVDWNPPFHIKTGDCFTISEGEVHQLHNSSGHKMIVVFGCSKTHITTDRSIVNGFND
ncbi:MAG: hypothetical protein N2484_02970 [Clostridia bacterium]|nr:hypothetical protein [Clostridia bacterium]